MDVPTDYTAADMQLLNQLRISPIAAIRAWSDRRREWVVITEAEARDAALLARRLEPTA